MSTKTKTFIDLNGVPYLLGEYLDRSRFRQIDRTLIGSSITVNNSEPYRAVVDINIDDIGKRASDGLPSTLGNRVKQKKLIQMICTNSPRLHQVIDTMRGGIVLRVTYRLENIRTGTVIRSASEDLKIPNRNYFVDINPNDINDNAIIVNFMDTIVSTLNEFTHGSDRMMLRLQSVQLYYDVLKRTPRQIGTTGQNNASDGTECGWGDPCFNPYYHHQQHQSYQNFNGYRTESVIPASWWMFNKFYHFDNAGKDIVLHTQEINDQANPSYLVPCGVVNINRAFEINPGHRIIFKVSVWKNDLTAVNNTDKIARALGTPMVDYPWRYESRDTFIRLLRTLLSETATNYNEMRVRELLGEMRALLNDNTADCPVCDIFDSTQPSDSIDPTNPGTGSTPPPVPGDNNTITTDQITDLINEFDSTSTPGGDDTSGAGVLSEDQILNIINGL